MPRSRPARASLLIFVLALTSCSESPRQQAASPPPPAVTVEKPVKRAVIDQDEYVGRFVAIDCVEIRARVSGYLSRIHFTDGQMVKKGDLLFTHRPAGRSRSRSTRCGANLAQARANLAFTEADLERGQELVHNKTITEQTFDQRTQAKRVAEAAVGRRRRWSHPPSSISRISPNCARRSTGRIGDRRVSRRQSRHRRHQRQHHAARHHRVGRSDPVRVHLRRGILPALPALRLERNRYGRPHRRRPGRAEAARRARLRASAARWISSIMSIDRSSGTIRGRAVFANADGVFTPGMFGRVRVPGSPPYTALLVPDAAIGTEQTRKYVLVVDDGDVGAAEIRHARPARRRPAGDQGRPRGDRPRHRQRPDAGAAGPEGRRRRSRRGAAGAAPKAGDRKPKAD